MRSKRSAVSTERGKIGMRNSYLRHVVMSINQIKNVSIIGSLVNKHVFLTLDLQLETVHRHHHRIPEWSRGAGLLEVLSHSSAFSQGPSL